ncbi:hypothetical protein ABTX81_39380 [Kitasatospora sp. NPDC097605]|uniref:hypothetical protein n=1 Tax=Kitasatospora sp. NPDC097605 TaxID=3157226 RepID=UPI0033256D2C
MTAASARSGTGTPGTRAGRPRPGPAGHRERTAGQDRAREAGADLGAGGDLHLGPRAVDQPHRLRAGRHAGRGRGGQPAGTQAVAGRLPA